MKFLEFERVYSLFFSIVTGSLKEKHPAQTPNGATTRERTQMERAINSLAEFLHEASKQERHQNRSSLADVMQQDSRQCKQTKVLRGKFNSL